MTDPSDPSAPTEEPIRPDPDAAAQRGDLPPDRGEPTNPASDDPVEDNAPGSPGPLGLPRAAVVASALGAAAAAPPRPMPVLAGRRQFARTTPVVIDRGRASFGFPSFGDRRQLGQIGLVVLMLAALAAILLARIDQPSSPGVAGTGSPSAQASIRPSAKPSPRPTASPNPSAASSTPPISPAPSPSSKSRTYKVKAGDTLSSIAAHFHTTAKAIEQLNAIPSPFVIHPGEVLKLP